MTASQIRTRVAARCWLEVVTSISKLFWCVCCLGCLQVACSCVK